METANLTDAELLELLNDIESDRVARKASFSGEAGKQAHQAVCAFANDMPGNDLPGVLFIGADDDGQPSGIVITDELVRNLTAMGSDGNILPFPVMTVQKRILQGAAMAVVTVMPSDAPPVRYGGRIQVRTGSRHGIANEQEERILNEKRRYKDIPFDIRPIRAASLDDLSRTVFENEYLPAAFATDVLEANDRSYEVRLASCKMFSLADQAPTVLGLLVAGERTRDFLPGAYIQFLRIDGTALHDEVVDADDFGGAIAGALRLANAKLQSHLRVGYDVTSKSTHQTGNPWPMPALQQILYNAVLHRSYEGTNAPVRIHWFDDRIEIHSPGGPCGNVTAENFGTGITDYRNPNVADAMKVLGFVQAFGRGISIAREAMQKNGNPEPEFEISQSAVVCILRGKA